MITSTKSEIAEIDTHSQVQNSEEAPRLPILSYPQNYQELYEFLNLLTYGNIFRSYFGYMIRHEHDGNEKAYMITHFMHLLRESFPNHELNQKLLPEDSKLLDDLFQCLGMAPVRASRADSIVGGMSTVLSNVAQKIRSIFSSPHHSSPDHLKWE